MARPIKVGLDYFPHECPSLQVIELIETEFGLVGYAVVYKLYEKIYFEKGYFCEWNRDVALMFARRNGVGVNVVSEIIGAAFRRGIFDKELYEKYGILTSAEIQSKYIEATVKRKEVNFFKEYLLVNYTCFSDNITINSINDNINSINSVNNQQSKVNKSKVNKSKVCSPSKFSIEPLTQVREDRELETQSANADTQSHFDYQKIVNLFNFICNSLPKVKILSDNRKKQIKNADKKLNGDFKNFFEKVEQSDFLTNRNGKWNGCSFDCILKP